MSEYFPAHFIGAISDPVSYMLSRDVSRQWIEEAMTKRDMHQGTTVSFPEDSNHAVFMRERDGQWTAWRALMDEACSTAAEATERCRQLAEESGIRDWIVWELTDLVSLRSTH